MTRFLFYLLSFLYYLFCLAVGIFPVFCSHIPTAVYFFAFLLGCGYFSCLLFSHTHSSLFFIAFLLGCGYFSCLMFSIPTAVYFLLHFCLVVGIFLDLCFPYPHFLFYLIFDGSCASIIAANISTHPALSLIDRLSCKITHPASTEKQDSRLSINDAIVGLTFLCPII
jgi:hypothetical protein